MTKDYYKILDIPEFSTQDEIKNAYRKLVRKYHPDIAGNSESVVNRFKDINEAYEFLSDKIKRYDYDKARQFYNYAKSSAKKQNAEQKDKSSYTAKPNFKNTTSQKSKDLNKNSQDEGWSNFSFNWEDLFSKSSSDKKTKKQNSSQKGQDIYSDIEISILDSINGTTKIINMLKTHVCPKCGGRKFVNGNVCSHCHGKGDISEYKKFNVKIPAGIKDKSRIRLAGEGEGINNGVNGDLYLTVHILSSQEYKLDGNNVLKTIAISPFEAVLGANITVDTPIGKVSLKISPNTQNGQKIRLSGCGIEQFGKYGDMIVTVEIKIPKNLSREEINLYKRLQEISSANVRDF